MPWATRIFTFFVTLLAVSWADAQINNPGSTTVNIPPPVTDWFARTISLVAICLALAGFAWGRMDKRHERKVAQEARDPSVDFDLTKGGRKGNYDYELKIVNRGDVSVQVLSLACDSEVTLKPDDADVSSDGRVVDYNGLRIERGENDTLVGELECKNGGPVKFTVSLRINEKTQRILKVPLNRNLS